MSELDDEAKDDYVDGFDELDDETEQKVDSFIKQFIKLVYTNKNNLIAKVTELTDDSVELCITEL